MKSYSYDSNNHNVDYYDKQLQQPQRNSPQWSSCYNPNGNAAVVAFTETTPAIPSNIVNLNSRME